MTESQINGRTRTGYRSCRNTEALEIASMLPMSQVVTFHDRSPPECNLLPLLAVCLFQHLELLVWSEIRAHRIRGVAWSPNGSRISRRPEAAKRPKACRLNAQVGPPRGPLSQPCGFNAPLPASRRPPFLQATRGEPPHMFAVYGEGKTGTGSIPAS